MAATRRKIKAGKTHDLTEPEPDDAGAAQDNAKVIDLVSLLKQRMGAKSRKPNARCTQRRRGPGRRRHGVAGQAPSGREATGGKVAKRSIGRAAETKSVAAKRKAA